VLAATPTRASTEEAVEFLSRWPTERVHLVAIHLNERGETGRVEGQTFEQGHPAVRAWIDDRQGRANLYFAVNDLAVTLGETKRLNKAGKLATVHKALEADVTRVVAFHVDSDFRDPSDEAKLRAKFEGFDPRPSVVVHSGGGLQAFFILAEPAVVTDDNREELKDRNRALERALDGDNCHNLDRIMRLPGTLNIPNRKKRERGRTENTVAKLLRFDAEPVALSDCPRAQPSRPGTPDDGGHHAADEEPLAGLDDDLSRLIRDGGQPKGKSRSEAVFHVACAMIRAGVPDSAILQVLLDRSNRISDHIYDNDDPQSYAERQLQRALAIQERPGPIVPKSDHMARARMFRAERRPNLLHWRDEFHDYASGRYEPVAASTIGSEVWAYLEGARARTKERGITPFLPNKASVAETREALAAVGHLPPRLEAPRWLDGQTGPSDLVSFPNGLLDLGTGQFLPPTPKWFSPFACGFDYDPDAPAPNRWLSFLDDVFLGERDQVDTLQEIIGYCLAPDASFQKVFLMLGPTRSGKGTIARMMRSLLASDTVCGPTLKSLDGEFGLQPLIGKQVAIISDMRIDRSRTNTAVIAERLLSISGGDSISIGRKYLSAWEGVLPIKFIIISNDLPAFADDSGALASRFINLQTRQSFYGREDRELDQKLRPERAGVLLWALEGRRRLYERGRFSETGTSLDIKQRLAVAGSEVQGFLEECCVLDPDGAVVKDVLYEKYQVWARINGLVPWEKSRWGNALLAAGDGRIRATKVAPTPGARRVPHYSGIRTRRTEDGDSYDGLPI
jgi:P4 family phage/plasmid primase-like protien